MSAPQLRFRAESGKNFPSWSTEKLNALAKIYDGTHMTPEYKISGVPFFSVEHLTSNNFKDTKFISEEVFEKENIKVKLEKGDILMTKIGDIGTAKYIDWDVRASFYVSLALIKQSSAVNSLFLARSIASPYFQKELHQRIIHVAFPKKINLGEIGECLVQLPCEQEQTKIANFLTAVDEKITQLTQKHDLLTQYKKGVMQQIFSQELRFKDDEGKDFPEWEDKYLSNICSIQKGKQLNKSELTSHDLYPVINGGQEPSGYTDIWNVEGNSITISEGGNSCGFVNFIKQKFWSGGHCYTLTALNDDISKSCLYQLLKFNEVKIMKLRVGSGLPNIQKSALSEFMVGFPISIKEQIKIANSLTAIDDKITVTQIQLKAVKQYKQGLLQQMFV